MAWKSPRSAGAGGARVQGGGGGERFHRSPTVFLEEYGLVVLPLGSGRASALARGSGGGQAAQEAPGARNPAQQAPGAQNPGISLNVWFYKPYVQ